MKKIYTILAITIFTFISCGENTSVNNENEVLKSDKNNNSETINEEIETTEEESYISYYNIDDSRIYTKVFDLFWIRDLEINNHKKIGFISLSDKYSLNDFPDSLYFPNHKNVSKDSLLYFKLKSTNRKNTLTKPKILETDSVFIYDYSTNVLLRFPVSELKVVAYLNIYMGVKDCPCDEYNYMIGYEVDNDKLTGLGEYYSDALVYIGKENPFEQGQMKAIVWKKIKIEKFPSEKSNLNEEQKQYLQTQLVKEQAYLYETETHQIFIQDYLHPKYPEYIDERHLIIIDKQNGEVVNETVFYNSEGAMVAPLNFGINNSVHTNLKEQWTGKLLKDKPEVIFGFEWISFGCPSILFINSHDKYIEINCDNRH